MFFAVSFAICIVRMKDSRPEMMIAIMMVDRFVSVRLFISWEIAAAAPVLVRLIEYRAMNERPITIVFIAPKRKRNSLWSLMLRKDLPISAA